MIRGKRIVLRTVGESDLDEGLGYWNDIRNRGEYVPLGLLSEVKMKKRFHETGFWERDEGTLHITDRDSHLLGLVQFWRPSSDPVRNTFEIGFALFRPQDRGKGYMTEAVSIFVPYLFETTNVHRIQATTLSGNKASQRVLEKCGFRFEGVLRQFSFHRGQYKDAHLYSILRGECGPLADQLA
jgi:RimJ/RimL family protein N-acetyltransferase